LGCHPRVTNIVGMILRRPASAASRALPYGQSGEFQPDGIIPCDVQYDTALDMPPEVRAGKGYEGFRPGEVRREVRPDLGSAGVARRAQDCGDAAVAGERPGQGMFPGPVSKDEDFHG
jgi:hypothetical protein